MNYTHIKFVAFAAGLSAISDYSAIVAASSASVVISPTTNSTNYQYPDAVISALKNSYPTSLIDAFTRGKEVLQNPAGSGAVVCIQQIANKLLYRSHSKNSTAVGIVTMPQDINSFEDFLPKDVFTPNLTKVFPRAINDAFVFSLPKDATNPQSPLTPFIGKVFYEGSDGFCMARFSQSAAPTDEDYPGLVLNFTGRQSASMQQVYAQALRIIPSPNGAVVCVQNTPQGLYRSHSVIPSAYGIVSTKSSISAFTALFGSQRGTPFTFALPENADGTGTQSQFSGQVIYSGPDGFCIARYKVSDAAAAVSAPSAVPVVPIVTVVHQ